MNSPFFSIVIPTYNRANMLSKAIESVIAQTHTDWELIIVDDGSTDHTKDLINEFSIKDSRIRYIFQENQERSAARNNGITHAKGEYICFLDSDDYYLKEKLNNFKRVIECQENSKNVVFYDGLVIETEKEQKSVVIAKKEKHLSIHEFLLLHPLYSQQICAARMILNKYKYNPLIRIGEDVELWLRISNEFDFIASDSFQTVILEHDGRSINLLKHNAAKQQLHQLKLIFQLHNNHQISRKIRKKVMSDCFFNSAKHFMMNGKKTHAIIQILKSIFKDPGNIQTKHRTYCLLKLITGQIPREYLKQ